VVASGGPDAGSGASGRPNQRVRSPRSQPPRGSNGSICFGGL
jgi:hypothetical protein